MQDAATQQTTAVPTPEAAEPSLLQPSPYIIGFTWVTFLVVSVILYKVAWKPILAALARREATVRKAQEDAARIRDELHALEENRKTTLAQAENQAKDMLDAARRAAEEAGRVIEEKARKEAQIMVENAERDINKAREKAVAVIRKESTDLSIALAGKLIGANLDDEKNRAMVDKLIDHM